MGFIIEAWICGFCRKTTHPLQAYGLGVISIIVVYIMGIAGFMAAFTWLLQKPMTLSQAVLLCAAPFVPFDCVKMILGVLIGKRIVRALEKAGVNLS